MVKLSFLFATLTAVMVAKTCAWVPGEAQCGCFNLVSPVVSFTQFILSNKVSECNCIKIDPRPIPKSQAECFSADYIATVRNFIKVNFGRVFSNYNMKKDSCDYKELLGYIQQLQNVALEGTTLLESTSSKLTQVDAIYNKYKGLLAQYNPAVRQFILNNDRSCYFNVRKSRMSPLTVTDAIIAILTKCIQYVDVPNKRC